jgi:hypothetical protein
MRANQARAAGVRRPMSDVVEIFLRVRRADIAYIKFIVESYEGVGLLRTIDPHAATIVIIAVPDFADTARRIVDAVAAAVPCEEIARPAELSDWLLAAIPAAGEPDGGAADDESSGG